MSSTTARAADRASRPANLWLLILLLFVQGVSATPAGLLLVLDPTGGRMSMPLSTLERSPFTDYLIPGLILFVVLGLGAFLVIAVLLVLPDWRWACRRNPFKELHWAWTASALFGIALMIWIVVQRLMVGGGTILQPLFFGIGLAILLLTLSAPVRRYLRREQTLPGVAPA